VNKKEVLISKDIDNRQKFKDYGLTAAYKGKKLKENGLLPEYYLLTLKQYALTP
jgi:hypothetical protein